ncbi:MAG TPA: sporulation protein YtfJ [Desulfotomaculum sp.]|nr:MAG: Sporulation protein YtfJ [Desulfotomaculum sp. 46_80]HAG11006.1 sporulation protein YtfJ [Desulfotomaculum sp.]HBY04881.1 sporulation protein YtfJ [Desulfotomaculum sp.]
MSEQHPIEGLMKTAMESIKEMIDVNTVIGDPVETPDGTIIIPISRVAFGFGAGGGEFEHDVHEKSVDEQKPFFGGGSGAGVSVQPVGFLVVGHGSIRLLPVENNVLFDRLIDLAPQVLEQIQSILNEKIKGAQKNNSSTLQQETTINTTPPL